MAKLLYRASMKDGKDDISTATGAVEVAAWIALPLLVILLAVLVWWQFPKDRATVVC
jgi:hypothetical protein